MNESESKSERHVTWAELQRRRQNWEELAARVTEMEAGAPSDKMPAPVLEFGEAKLAAIATSIYNARRRRLELFDPALFGEPAWDMLLNLFIAKARGEVLSTAALCSVGGVPHATGLRRIDHLEAKGLIERSRDPADARVTQIQITPKGYRLMRQYVIDGITRFQMPMPDHSVPAS